jgi:hypothetical protein
VKRNFKSYDDHLKERLKKDPELAIMYLKSSLMGSDNMDNIDEKEFRFRLACIYQVVDAYEQDFKQFLVDYINKTQT